MPALHIYLDLTPNQAYPFLYLEHCQKTKGYGTCHLPILPRYHYSMLPCHSLLHYSFVQYCKKDIIYPSWKFWYEDFEQCCAKGWDLLFITSIANENVQKRLLNVLQERAQGYTFTVTIVYAPAVVALEWAAMTEASLFRSIENWTAHCNVVAQTSKLPAMFAQELGAENVTVLFDAQASPYAAHFCPAVRSFLTELGFVAEEPSFFHPFMLHSQTARDLYLNATVGWNRWPPIEEAELFSALRRIEDEVSWRSQPLSPPKAREEMQSRVAQMLEDFGDFAPKESSYAQMPPNFAPDAPWEPYTGIGEEDIDVYVRKLPQTMRNILGRRYQQDRLALSPIQEKIASRIQVEKAKEQTLVPSKERPKNEPLLTVLTPTYNHEKYIGKCIESVAAQRTKFPVRHIILDDCSTDATADIVIQYARRNPNIVPVLLQRKTAGGNVLGLFKRCQSEFVSLCEGDDYFTRSEKLQKQVDFLQAHQECALCFHPVDVTFEDGTPPHVYPPVEYLPGGIRHFYTIAILLNRNTIQTNSVVYRWRFRDGVPSWFVPNLCPADWYWHLLHAEMGLIGYLPERMSVYRRHKGALYIETEYGNFVKHRILYGMGELRTYSIMDEHFKGKFFASFSELASSVYTNFVQYYFAQEDDSYLKRAIKAYPKFSKHFFEKMQQLVPQLVPKVEEYFAEVMQP